MASSLPGLHQRYDSALFCADFVWRAHLRFGLPYMQTGFCLLSFFNHCQSILLFLSQEKYIYIITVQHGIMYNKVLPTETTEKF